MAEKGWGSCKTAVPQKIDDFDASSQGQHAGSYGGLGRADEALLEQVGEEAREELATKGRFSRVHDLQLPLKGKKKALAGKAN